MARQEVGRRTRCGDPVNGKPQAVRALVAKLRRRGVVITLVGGRVQVDGWTQLEPSEKAELREEKDRVVTWLESRELRRQRRAEKRQQQPMATAQQQQRKVVGQVVNPGGPLKLLYDDECKPIAPSARARQLPSIGWTKFMGGD